MFKQAHRTHTNRNQHQTKAIPTYTVFRLYSTASTRLRLGIWQFAGPPAHCDKERRMVLVAEIHASDTRVDKIASSMPLCHGNELRLELVSSCKLTYDLACHVQ